MGNRTLITGMGIVSCIGSSLSEVEQSLRDGRCGLSKHPNLLKAGFRSPLMGVPLMPPITNGKADIRKIKTLSLAGQYAAHAAYEAIANAALSSEHLRNAALIVSNDSSAEECRNNFDILKAHGDNRYLGSGAVFRSLNSSVSMNLAQLFHIGGLSLTVSAACAGGGHAVGLAHDLIRAGAIECAVVIGAQETGVNAFAAFDALGVFANDDDAKISSRPFDVLRHGLVPSGGAACIILESEAHAARRHCSSAVGTVDGYGFSTSPNIVSPDADSECRCMGMALWNAQKKPYGGDVQLISAHATGTRDGDAAEFKALDDLFGISYADRPPFVTATKSLTGHECWMAGVSSVVYTLLQMNGMFRVKYPHFTGLDGAGNDSLSAILRNSEGHDGSPLNTALINAFGFGGTNSSIVISKM